MTHGSDDLPLPAADIGAPRAAPALIDVGRWRAGGVRWWLTLATVVADQLAKAAINATVPLYASKTVVPRFIDLVHVHNAGLAYGLMNDSSHPHRAWLTTGLAVAALAGIAYYARHVQPGERLARLGLSLILGGAIGNLVDRVRQGYVIDFVDVYWGQWHFWAFNVADAAITVGAVLVFVEILFLSRHASHPVSDR